MGKSIRTILSAMTALILCGCATREKWTPQQANEWYGQQDYIAGANFAPSDSINQIEMWSAETFNPALIDKELAYAEELGFNSMRVFLHDMVWENDREGFYKRIDKFLEIAKKHNMKILFVFFDSCWNPVAKLGKQPEPRFGVHNSGWVQSPTRERLLDEKQWNILEEYVVEVVSRYKNDDRVLAWDLFNEPAQTNGDHFGKETGKTEPTRKLLQNVFVWARSANPSQPLTAGVYNAAPYKADKSDKDKLNDIMLGESDIITFHFYGEVGGLKNCVESLKRFNRPIFCTEYMARPGSTFNPCLGYMKSERVGAYNWGLVDGKTNTKYPWNSWDKNYDAKKLKIWHHDILNRDGTPFDKAETDYIKSVLKK